MDAQVNPAFYLALELIVQSVRDSTSRVPHYREEALAWFRERSQMPCGYGWCLRVTGANPNVVRKYIGKRWTKNIGVLQAE